MPQAHRLGPQSRLQDREILRRESPEEAVADIGLLEGGHEGRLWGKSTRRPSITSARTMAGDDEKMVFATKTASVAQKTQAYYRRPKTDLDQYYAYR
jgi:hypothetical protein